MNSARQLQSGEFGCRPSGQLGECVVGTLQAPSRTEAMPTSDRLNISSRSRASISSWCCCCFSRVMSDSTAIASTVLDGPALRRTDSAYQNVCSPSPLTLATSNSVSWTAPSARAFKVCAAISCACGCSPKSSSTLQPGPAPSVRPSITSKRRLQRTRRPPRR